MTIGRFLREVHAIEGELRSSIFFPQAAEVNAGRKDVAIRLHGSSDLTSASVILYAYVDGKAENEDELDAEWEKAAIDLLSRVKAALAL